MTQQRRRYSPKFKAKMIQRMSGPNPEPGVAVAREMGVAQSTLSRWLNEAGSVGPMKKTEDTPPTRPSEWSAEKKLLIVAKAMAITDDKLGAFLRQEGVHAAQLEEWKRALVDALKAPPRRPGKSKERKRIRVLERELGRKDAALAETAALLVLQGKAQALWGDEGDGI